MNKKKFTPLVCKKGDVVFLSIYTVHQTGLNGDDRLRVACSTRIDNGDEITFIKKGYPFAYKRVSQRQ